MSIRSSKMAVALLAGLAVLALARCSDGSDETVDAGTVKKDGGPPPAGKDAAVEPAEDAGPNIGTDAGRPDGSTSQTVETTIPAINNLDSANHPAEGSKVHFKGVVMSPMWRLSKSTSNTDPTRWNCLFGVYLADATGGAEYNGVLVASKSTVDATTKECNLDSPLHKVQSTGNFTIGEEVEITGFYNEYCYKASGSQACADQFNNKGISTPQISSNMESDVVRTGQTPGVPAGLPVTVTINDIYSTQDATSKAITALGANWWKYRMMLVKLENVKVVDNTTPPSNNWLIASATAATPTLIVNDDGMYDGADHAPAQDSVLTSLQGFVYWTYSSTQLSPRTKDDAVPPMP